MYLLFLAACHGPGETGPGGMVGRIVDPAGAPLEGIRVMSVEAESRTDAAGHFAVEWKEPDTHVFFELQGTFWRRALQADDPAEVTLQLPSTREAELDCADRDGLVKLSWSMGPGFVASRSVACRPEAKVLLQGLPPGVPSVELKQGSERVLTEAIEVEGGIRLVPPEVPVRVDVQSTEGAAPSDCVVMVGGDAARSAGEGLWVAGSRGSQAVRVVCEGRAAWPLRFQAGAGSVTVDWSRTGPTVDLEGALPEAAVMRIAADGSGDWLVLRPDSNGVFALPPLASGLYRARIGRVDSEDGQDVAFPEPGRSGQLTLVDAPEGLVGTLRLDADQSSGRIPVSLP